jgi:hypothetical protein
VSCPREGAASKVSGGQCSSIYFISLSLFQPPDLPYSARERERQRDVDVSSMSELMEEREEERDGEGESERDRAVDSEVDSVAFESALQLDAPAP